MGKIEVALVIIIVICNTITFFRNNNKIDKKEKLKNEIKKEK